MTATDRTFRAMARAEPETLLGLLRVIALEQVPKGGAITPVDVLASWVDLAPPTDADWVGKIARRRRILHVECQGYRDATFLMRIVRYHAALALRFPTWRVKTFALWVIRPPRRQRLDTIRHHDLSVDVTSVVLREVPVAVLLASPASACFAPVGDPGDLSPEEVCARTVQALAAQNASWYQWSIAQTMARVAGWQEIMTQAIKKLERPDIILIDFVKMGRDDGRKEGRRIGRREGKLDLLTQMFEYRLGRPLSEDERAVIARRLRALGADRVSQVVLDLSARKLAAWLTDP
jgi:hypothetical protein